MTFIPEFPENIYQPTVFDAVGGQTDYAFDWPYIGQEDFTGSNSPYILVMHISDEGIKTFPVFTMPSSTSIRLSVAQSEGQVIILRQSWVNGRLVNHAGGSTLSEALLELESKQNWYFSEEIVSLSRNSFEVNEDSQKFNALFTFDGDGATASFRLENVDTTVNTMPSKIATWVLLNGSMVQSDDFTLTQDFDDVVLVTLGRTPAVGEFVEIRIAQFQALAIALDNGSIQCQHLAPGAICELSKFALDGIGSSRQIMGWDGSSIFGARTLTHDDISDFDAEVEGKRLDQFANPTADLNMNTNKLTNGAEGTDPTDFATVSQLLNFSAGTVKNHDYMSAPLGVGSHNIAGYENGVWAAWVHCKSWGKMSVDIQGINYLENVATEGSAGNLAPCFPVLITISTGQLEIVVNNGSVKLITAIKVG